MNVAWSSVSFGYYLISYYLKYIPGDLYTNVILSSIAEMASAFSSGWISKKIGNKNTLIISYMTSCIFSLILAL